MDEFSWIHTCVCTMLPVSVSVSVSTRRKERITTRTRTRLQTFFKFFSIIPIANSNKSKTLRQVLLIHLQISTLDSTLAEEMVKGCGSHRHLSKLIHSDVYSILSMHSDLIQTQTHCIHEDEHENEQQDATSTDNTTATTNRELYRYELLRTLVTNAPLYVRSVILRNFLSSRLTRLSALSGSILTLVMETYSSSASLTSLTASQPLRRKGWLGWGQLYSHRSEF